jgi:hypothetical protein
MITAKTFVRLFLAAYLAIVAMLLITYFTTPFYGDLTRIGLLPESLFGWRQPQPGVPAALLQNSKTADADIVVIGDSFSVSMVWQSELVKGGLKVKTLNWDDVGSLCENVERWLKHAGFRDRGIVIIESTQSMFDKHLNESLICRGAKQPFTDMPRSGNPPPISSPLGTDVRNGTEKITTGIAQLWNGHMVKTQVGAQRFGSKSDGDIPVARPVARGCEWFSHVLCSKALFNEKDDARAPLGNATLDNIKKIGNTLADYRVVWLIIPDKTTIYFEKDAAFWVQLESSTLGPNLYKPFLAARDANRDFYFPNDTHLSTSGLLLLGKITHDYIATANSNAQ